MKEKIEIKSISGELLFELEKENNSVKDTLEEAVKRGVNLSNVFLKYANLENANLRGANLRGADLRETNLKGADLRETNLRDANLIRSNLECSDLFQADLRNAVLIGADLLGANLEITDLRNIDLRDAYLRDANIRDADLRDANLSGSKIRNANFSNANLKDVNLKETVLYGSNFRNASLSNANLMSSILREVNFSGANLSGAKNIPFIPTYMPDGKFIGWKKLRGDLIAKLEILEDSKRSRGTGDRCRCDKCMVLDFQNLDGSKSNETTYTCDEYYTKYKYIVGKVVCADKWDDNRWNKCSHGIHFFIDRQSAVDFEII